MVTITLIILVGAVGVFLTYVLIKRLSAKDLSGEQSDPGSTSNQTTELSEILSRGPSKESKASGV